MNTSTVALSSSSSPVGGSRRSHHHHHHHHQAYQCRKMMSSAGGSIATSGSSGHHHHQTSSETGAVPSSGVNLPKFKDKPLQWILEMIHRAFEKEEKPDELEQMINEICGGQEFIYRRQQEIDVLCSNTAFNRQEIKLLYWGWKLACPEGVLNENIFKDIYAQFFPQAGDSSLYARYVYQAMFGDGIAKQEQITFFEYAKALSTLCRGSLMDKIRWIFNLYDINRDGQITYDEVFKISVAIYALLGFHVTPAHNLKTYEQHAKKVFAKLDPNKTGRVTFEQFRDICLKDETIITSMQQLSIESI